MGSGDPADFVVVMSVLVVLVLAWRLFVYKPSAEAGRLVDRSEAPRLKLDRNWLTLTSTAVVTQPLWSSPGADKVVYREDTRFVGVEQDRARPGSVFYFYDLRGRQVLRFKAVRSLGVESLLRELGWTVVDLGRGDGLGRKRPRQLPNPPIVAADDTSEASD